MSRLGVNDMNNRELVQIIQEELQNDKLDPIRNAKLRFIAEVNGEFRLQVEHLLCQINDGTVSEVEAAKVLVELVCDARNKLLLSQLKVENVVNDTDESPFLDAQEFLIQKYTDADIKQLTKRQYENILAVNEDDIRYSWLKKEREQKATQQESEDKSVEESPFIQDEDRPVDDAKIKEILDEADKMIGLSPIKELIHRQVAYVKLNLDRKKYGLDQVPQTLHMVFTGNPGTGKTTVARLIGRIYKELGLLSRGGFHEYGRADLVDSYIGDTEKNTKAALESSLGGVFFIDEAYALLPEGTTQVRDYGPRVIETMLKFMEDHRDNIVIIVAGYKDEMKTFINGNPGLKSRFTTYVEFDDYSSDELFDICKKFLSDYGFTILATEAEKLLRSYFDYVTAHIEKGFGNARYSRNLAENISTQAAYRLYRPEGKYNVFKDDIITVLESDVNDAIRSECPKYFEENK